MLTLLFLACNTADQSFSASNNDIATEQGSAILEYSPNVLVVTDVIPDISFAAILTVNSVGDNALAISEIDVTDSADGVFYIEPGSASDITLPTDASREIYITVFSPNSEIHEGEIRIKSNNEAGTDIRVPICSYPEGYDGEISCGSGDQVDTASQDTAE